MCGIVAILDKKREIFEQISESLTYLQHRGQDACGIITNSKDEFFCKKELGTVTNTFEHIDKNSLKGKIGVGHTRYATQGKNRKIDLQPLFTKNSPKISMAHNGNITNYFDLKRKLKQKGFSFQTSVDAEVLINLFSLNYKESQDFFTASKKVLKEAKGAFSIVGMIEGKGIFAIRDSHGFKPLVLGKNKNSYAFASETVAFQKTGFKYVKDVEPGEAIFISTDLKIESKILYQKKIAHCMFEWVYFADPSSIIEKRSVYKARLALGKLLNKKIKKENSDFIIPVPDSGRTAAIKLSEDTKIKYREGLMKNKYIQRTFIMPSQKIRKNLVNKKLIPITNIIKGKNIIVVDDSIVRGNTSKNIITILKEGGVKNITFVSTCPPIKHCCFYGIDFSNKNELIASKKSQEEIREYLKADSLIYTNVEDVKKAIKRDICTACLTGKYPQKISKKQKKQLGSQRLKEQTKLDNSNHINVLIIGSGGREHSLALKVFESKLLNKLYAIPGNPGINKIAKCFDLDIMDNKAILDFAKSKKIDLVIVGPEMPLVNGLADILSKNGIRVFGPNKKAAKFEASKSFSRNFMKKYKLPTIEYKEFTNFKKAKKYIIKKGIPIVVKADGLAAGKGVCVATELNDAIEFANLCLNGKFGEKKIIVEEYLEGEEASFLVFLDSKTYIPMPYSQDHKTVFDGDKGPNTGGMGAYSPAPILNGLEKELEEKIMLPFIWGIKKEKIKYKGVLYVGLKKTKDGLKILEFNCRFGDPETQVILPRLKTDLLKIMNAVIDEKLCDINPKWSKKHCVSVVLASKGYPKKYETGKRIKGLDNSFKVKIIHAGTKKINNNILTDGGRVLNIVSLSKTLKSAVEKAYCAVKKIEFNGMFYRKDIAQKELRRQK